MANKYLDENGLLYFWQKIKAKFVESITYDTTNHKIVQNKNGSSSDVVSAATLKEDMGLSDAYIKPANGIPSSDMTTAVQTSLGLADTSLQKKSEAGIVYSAANSTTTSATTGAQIVSAIGNTAVARATGDANGNNISTTYAPLASPAFTGAPTAPTATAGTSSTQVATTAFVSEAVAAAQIGAATFKGVANVGSDISGTDYKKGWYWVVGTAGTYVGQQCEAGDMVFAIEDKGASYSASDFSVVQTNLDITSITNAEIDAIVAA